MFRSSSSLVVIEYIHSQSSPVETLSNKITIFVIVNPVTAASCAGLGVARAAFQLFALALPNMEYNKNERQCIGQNSILACRDLWLSAWCLWWSGGSGGSGGSCKRSRLMLQLSARSVPHPPLYAPLHKLTNSFRLIEDKCPAWIFPFFHFPVTASVPAIREFGKKINQFGFVNKNAVTIVEWGVAGRGAAFVETAKLSNRTN